jgi:chromosome segregation protein
MKFSRLRLHGFKSFCDHTELLMEPGLTGIVGPNGCGKSNLVEAMRWVMGESSYKAMRAAGMDEVIFSGAASRPGRNSAEVTLVLDNSDRTAPALLNGADTLEVTRRIEREAGSVYRVNGREVRARDVQLLFADASTGAHSPALVRQGQIGELIAAKPTARRALLEEAAGISGLHSRRHEAELRLRAADQNLERVDDVIAQVETQLETLKRQARLAVRYRSISGDIRRTEATLYHIRWVGLRVAEKEAEAEQSRLIRDLADATHAERLATSALERLDADIDPLRNAEAAAGATLQRLTILLEQLEEEVQRGTRRRAEFENRMAQLAADARRETALVAEAETTLAAQRAEFESLGAEANADIDVIAAARDAFETARQKTDAAQHDARLAADALAQVRARRSQAQRSAIDAETRLKRLRDQVAQLAEDILALERQVAADDAVDAHRTALEARQAEAASAEQAAIAAEEASAIAQEALDGARPRLQDIEAALTRLEAEAATIAKLLNVGGTLWPAIVDALKVEPGYETALGAALGDDLDASEDAGAPVHWSMALDGSDDPPLPQGAEPLSRYVSGSPLLKRRLDQIGLIDAVDSLGLVRALRPGQRLVTLDGDLWRWDGLVAAADAPSAAAQRLAQRNRLAELDDDITRLRAERNARKREVEALIAALDAARQAEKARREDWRTAQHAIGAARSALDSAQRAIGDLATRRSALEEARIRLGSSLEEAEAVHADALRALAQETDERMVVAAAQSAEEALGTARETAERARATLQERETTARLRTARIEQLAADMAATDRRLTGARAQIDTLATREDAVRDELAALKDNPDGVSARRQTLEGEIETARIAHRAATDSLAVAQRSHRDAAIAARGAAENLANARIALGRVEERLKGAIGQRQQIETQITEALGIPASRTLEASGIRPEAALPDEGQTAQRLDRLKAERERLGGVNLSAEKEAEETQARLDLMVKDRDDLIEAIAKLRQGIQTLNREGRARLTDAFERVNTHFRALFTTLFGGGTAELTFVESDDPLEAGLEIIARPPGKKPQTMTLLSGGEQALTALSLIFAVFLTNPAPICVLDEVDAPLDDANVERFCNLLDDMRRRTDTRFLVVTHNPITMSRVDRLFGVTQAERGVSQLVSVDLTTAESFREAV